jgi:hypothetical protein
MIINPYFFEQPLLLDLYPNAATAYSVRKLRTAYTGNCIRVRRSSDNAEQNIGFVNNDLDTTSLLSFVGANNGFVTTWYDQSGNGFNVRQTTAANQPRIVNAGVLDVSNSKPTIRFSGFQNDLILNGISIFSSNNYRVMFTVNKWNTVPTSGARVIYTINSGIGAGRFAIYASTNVYTMGASLFDGTGNIPLTGVSTFNNTNMYLTTGVVDYVNADGFIYFNGNLDNSNLSYLGPGTTPVTNSNTRIGSGGTTATTSATNISEIITYISPQNIININTNIQTYFGI